MTTPSCPAAWTGLAMTGALPPLGLGTSGLGGQFGDDDAACVDAVATALDLGYRHIDTAQMYGNEHLVGAGLDRAAVPREEVFLATKVLPENLAYADVLESTRRSLEQLGTETVDLLYVHWPLDAYDPVDTLPAFDELLDDGLIEHVGLSNVTVPVLEEAQSVLDAPVTAVQMQVSPMLPPSEGERAELLPYAESHDIDVVAWSPLVRGEALDLEPIRTVADRHETTPAPVILAWLMAYGLKPVVKSSSRAHLAQNLTALDLQLDEDDVALLESIETRRRLFDRKEAPWNR